MKKLAETSPVSRESKVSECTFAYYPSRPALGYFSNLNSQGMQCRGQPTSSSSASPRAAPCPSLAARCGTVTMHIHKDTSGAGERCGWPQRTEEMAARCSTQPAAVDAAYDQEAAEEAADCEARLQCYKQGISLPPRQRRPQAGQAGADTSTTAVATAVLVLPLVLPPTAKSPTAKSRNWCVPPCVLQHRE